MIRDYTECTIRQYKDIQNILHSDKDQILKTAELVAYVNGVDHNTLTIDYVRDNMSSIDFITNTDYLLVKAWSKGERSFSITLDAFKMKAYQYIDTMNTIKTQEDTELHIINNMDKLCAILFVETSEDVEHFTHDELCEFLNENLTMDVVLPMTLFFSKVLMSLMPHIVDSLQEVVDQIQKQQDIQRIGGG